MKSLVVCTIFATGCLTLPQSYQPYTPRPQIVQGSNPEVDLPSGCRLEWQTFHSVEETEAENLNCTPYMREQCQWIDKNECQTVRSQRCDSVPQERCHTKFERVCTNLQREVHETYTEDLCRDEYVRTCQKHWRTYENGDKVWEEDPSTCKKLPRTKCQPVSKSRNKQEPYKECKNVPREECNVVHVEKCYPVSQDLCKNVPRKECRAVPIQKCETVHSRIPQSKTTRRQVVACDNNIDDVDIINNPVGKEKNVKQNREGTNQGVTFFTFSS